MVTQTHLTPVAVRGNDQFPWAKSVTLTTGNISDYKAGHIVGKITASGKYCDALAANVGGALAGSETADAVLLEDADTTLTDKIVLIGTAGRFIDDNMTGLTASYRTALRLLGIQFE